MNEYFTLSVSVITGLVSSFVTFIVARNKSKIDTKLESSSEAVLRKLLEDKDWKIRSFSTLKLHFPGMTEEKIRNILIGIGAISINVSDQEAWGLAVRNEEYFGIEKLEGNFAAREIIVEFGGKYQRQQQQQQQVQRTHEEWLKIASYYSDDLRQEKIQIFQIIDTNLFENERIAKRIVGNVFDRQVNFFPATGAVDIMLKRAHYFNTRSARFFGVGFEELKFYKKLLGFDVSSEKHSTYGEEYAHARSRNYLKHNTVEIYIKGNKYKV